MIFTQVRSNSPACILGRQSLAGGCLLFFLTLIFLL
nr:MAG TPA: hypothetical protein [Caudoviricetes sp.]